ncbi:hypothetical protein PIB30_117074 [Stylosanthes scabra]|uniref:Retrotransposon Copia-like N-terminal domain-containing protein n=1 Tax=Stylosanthes scabra TaxID=79078 RepID=A0ABU6W407_9FABA|nr:hypothetical protein [Stylosanthes scabra]
MMRALKSKNKLGFIDGTVQKPNREDPEFVAWEKCNTFVVSWLNLSLSSDIAQSVAWNELAVDLWEDLKHRYYRGDEFRIAELEEELYAMKQGDLSITTYYTKLKVVWEEIEGFQPIPPCVLCKEKCECGLDMVRSYRRRTYAVRFLRGLNEQYGAVRSQIMLMKPIPTINEIFPLLTQQERQLTGSDLETHSFAALANSIHNFNDSTPSGKGRGGRGVRGGRGGRVSLKTCSYCHKTGHLVDTCYQKHGYPPHLQRSRLPREFSNVVVANDIVAKDDENQNSNQKLDKQNDVQVVTNQSLREALYAFLRQECAQPHKEESMRDTFQPVAGKRESEFLEDDWHS